MAVEKPKSIITKRHPLYLQPRAIVCEEYASSIPPLEKMIGQWHKFYEDLVRAGREKEVTFANHAVSYVVVMPGDTSDSIYSRVIERFNGRNIDGLSFVYTADPKLPTKVEEAIALSLHFQSHPVRRITQHKIGTRDALNIIRNIKDKSFYEDVAIHVFGEMKEGNSDFYAGMIEFDRAVYGPMDALDELHYKLNQKFQKVHFRTACRCGKKL